MEGLPEERSRDSGRCHSGDARDLGLIFSSREAANKVVTVVNRKQAISPTENFPFSSSAIAILRPLQTASATRAIL